MNIFIKMKIHYNPKLKELARQLRNNATKAEIKLWMNVNKDQFFGYDFHRQKPIGNYIADFYCHQLKLVIEVDGITHHRPAVIEKDKIKEKAFESLGLTVLRFDDEEVLDDIKYVMKELTNYIVEFEERKE